MYSWLSQSQLAYMSAALVYNECYNPNSNRRMEPRLRKDKNSVSNINININLKVESKANYIGKKITNSKEIQQKESDAVRPNITTESLKRKKKMEFANTRCKRSLIEFIEENTISYEQEDLTPNKREEKGISRRDKSRSMQNLKAKSRQENCPGKQMERTSKSKDQSRSRSYRNSNSKSNSYSYKKSHQKSPLRSAERSKSKSKSQQHRLNNFKDKSEQTSPLIIPRKSSAKLAKNSKEIKNLSASKIIPKIVNKKAIAIPVRQIGQNDKSARPKSINKIAHSNAPKKHKNRKQVPPIQTKKQVTKKKRVVDNRPEVYPLPQILQSVIKIQSCWRGYRVRKQFRQQLHKITNKAEHIKQTITSKQNSPFWNDNSESNSIVQIDVDAMELEKENIEDFWSRDSKEKKNISSLMKGEDKRDQAMLIDRLMKQFEEQEIKFKRLEEENQILKSSIEKITYTYSQNEKVGITNAAHAVVHNESVGVYNEAVGVHNKFVGVHNESVGLHTAPSKTLFAAQVTKQMTDSAQKAKFNTFKTDIDQIKESQQVNLNNQQNIKQKHIQLVINTQDLDTDRLSARDDSKEMQKKNIRQKYKTTQMGLDGYKIKLSKFQCSPKYSTSLDQGFIKKLMLKKQVQLLQRYKRKNQEYIQMAVSNMLSPKSFNFKQRELDCHFQAEKELTLLRLKQAQKALNFIKEIDQQLPLDSERALIIHNQDEQQEQKETNESDKSMGKSNNEIITNINVIQIDEFDVVQLEMDATLTNQSKDSSLLFQKCLRSDKQKQRSEDDQQYKQKSEYGQQRDCDVQQQSPQPEVETEQIDGHKVRVFNIVLEHNSHPTQTNRQREQQQQPQQQYYYDVPCTKGGFDTSLIYTRNFVVGISEFFRGIATFKRQVLGNLSREIEYDKLLLLKSYRTPINEHDPNSPMLYPYFRYVCEYSTVIPIQIFTAFQNQELVSREGLMQVKAKQTKQRQVNGYSTYELMQYCDMSLFDAFNQALNFERPGGAVGGNLGLLTSRNYVVHRKNLLDSQVSAEENQDRINMLLSNCVARLINDWAGCLCGFINDQEECELEARMYDEEKLREIRETRLAMLLQLVLAEEGKELMDHTLQLIDVKLVLSRRIQSMLVAELTDEMALLEQSKSLRRSHHTRHCEAYLLESPAD